MTSYKEPDTLFNENERLFGQVKWFNNKAGYGFIVVVNNDEPREGTEVFVHHSAIIVENKQYKYLVQGEFVELNVVKTESKNHEWQASRVSGISGCDKLMCEIRRDMLHARNEYRSTKQPDELDMSRQHNHKEITATSAKKVGLPRQPTGDKKCGHWQKNGQLNSRSYSSRGVTPKEIVSCEGH